LNATLNGEYADPWVEHKINQATDEVLFIFNTKKNHKNDLKPLNSQVSSNAAAAAMKHIYYIHDSMFDLVW
jgi:hypothetical protein